MKKCSNLKLKQQSASELRQNTSLLLILAQLYYVFLPLCEEKMRDVPNKNDARSVQLSLPG